MTHSAAAVDLDKRWKLVAIAAIVAGVVLRLVWGLWVHSPVDHVYSDMEGYVERAQRLAEGGPFTRFDVFYPPGAHMLLAVPLRLLGTGRGGLWAGAVLWALLSSLVPLLTWLWLRRFLSPRASAIAAALVAFWPVFVTYGGFFLSEIPSLVFLVLTLYLIDQAGESTGRRAILLGAAAGVAGAIALSVRPQLLVNFLIAAWVLLFVYRKRHVATVALVGLVLPLAGLLAFNAYAAGGKLTGISENGGLNFFQGHCPVHTATTILPGTGEYRFASPVAVQTNRGRDYVFPNHIAWEQSYLFKQGLRCIKEDGVRHVGVLIRNTADLGVTSVPWPQSNEIGLRRFVRPSNFAYMLLLPIIAGAGVALAAARPPGGLNGPAILLAHLAAMVPTALVFYGDPRFRMAYDVFGLALLAAIVDWLFRRRALVSAIEGGP